jgi:hypothetical protein
MITIKGFCKRHHACADDEKWAIDNCSDMKQVWDTAKPELLVWIATRAGVLTDEELRLFAICAARQVQHLMTDQRSINALDIAMRYLNGAATESELAVARRAAMRVSCTAANVAALYAVIAASCAGDAARASAATSARDAASASSATLFDAAWNAARDAQARYLRANCKPIFKGEVKARKGG